MKRSRNNQPASHQTDSKLIALYEPTSKLAKAKKHSIPLLPIAKKNTSSLPAAANLRVLSTLTEAAPPLFTQST